MRYRDTSALVPLVVAETETQRMRSLLEEDPHIVTWAWTSVEFASAVERRAREGELTWEQRRDALSRFAELAEVWDEVTDVLTVRRRALAVLSRHPLRAGDAAQRGPAEGWRSSARCACGDGRRARGDRYRGVTPSVLAPPPAAAADPSGLHARRTSASVR